MVQSPQDPLTMGRKWSWDIHSRNPLVNKVFNHLSSFPKTCTCQSILINVDEVASTTRDNRWKHTWPCTIAGFNFSLKWAWAPGKNVITFNHHPYLSLLPAQPKQWDSNWPLLWFLIKFWDYTKSEELLFNGNEKPVKHEYYMDPGIGGNRKLLR